MYSSLYSSMLSDLYTVIGTSYADISFNDYNLQNGSVNITDLDIETPSRREYISKNRGLSHGMNFIDVKDRDRLIKVKGYLIASTRQAVEELADTFKKNIHEVQAYFRVKTRGTTWRQILATATVTDMPRAAYNVTKIPFSIVFTANESYFHDVNNDASAFSSITSASYIDNLDNDGTADMGVKIVVAFGSSGNSGVTSVALTANDRTITIADTFANSDIIVIDIQNKRVLLNGVKHDYSGTFPTFSPGVNQFTMVVNGTHTYDIVAVKTLKYL